jgi:hypothetical protein
MTISTEDSLLLWKGYKEYYGEELMPSSVSFEAFVKSIEAQTEITMEVYSKKADCIITSNIAEFVSMPEGIIYATLVDDISMAPHYSINMIVTRNKKPKELFALLHKLKELYFQYNQLPVFIEAYSDVMVKRFLREIKEEQGLTVRKLGSTFIVS